MNTSTNNHNAAARPRQGFTLIEMMAVIVIIAILAALIVSVGLYLRHDSGNKTTMATMDVLSTAIEAYQADKGFLPDEDRDGKVSAAVTEIDAARERSKSLRRELELANLKCCDERVANLPQEALGSDGTFVDGFGNPIDYRMNKGMGGASMLISAGPDGKFGYVKTSSPDDWWYPATPSGDREKDNIQK